MVKNKKNKNATLAFTLIELLAVIVILAIIALIATPIILGIVENTKKDAFLRSVELVISTTDIDILNKIYEKQYVYRLENGSISNLEVGIKNTKDLNGSIIYDSEGKSIYAIYNNKYCVRTLENAKVEVIDYNGECSITIKFEDFINISTENDLFKSGNGQIIDTGKYGIRYQGNNPNNYVYFNCSDYSNSTKDTCELWRIIGVVDGKIKLIRNDNLKDMAWDDTSNNWNTSSLKNYLNNEYLAELNSKNPVTGQIISPSTWYLKSGDASTKDTMYDLERTTGRVREDNPPYIENTKIGLMYPSDYAYAAMETDKCLSTTFLSFYNQCAEDNWLFNLKGESFEWTIIPDINFGDFAFLIDNEGNVFPRNRLYNTFEVRPVVYLPIGAKFNGGLGTKDNPYTNLYLNNN